MIITSYSVILSFLPTDFPFGGLEVSGLAETCWILFLCLFVLLLIVCPLVSFDYCNSFSISPAASMPHSVLGNPGWVHGYISNTSFLSCVLTVVAAAVVVVVVLLLLLLLLLSSLYWETLAGSVGTSATLLSLATF